MECHSSQRSQTHLTDPEASIVPPTKHKSKVCSCLDVIRRALGRGHTSKQHEMQLRAGGNGGNGSGGTASTTVNHTTNMNDLTTHTFMQRVAQPLTNLLGCNV